MLVYRVKKEKNAEPVPSQQSFDEKDKQNQDMFTIRDTIVQLSLAELRNLLSHNSQHVPKGKDRVSK
jgi:hypothetical protein